MATLAFIREFIEKSPLKDDIFDNILKKTDPFKGLGSDRDYMLILGEYSITNPKEITQATTYLTKPLSSDKIKYLLELLIKQYGSYKMQGLLKVVIPVHHFNQETGLAHWILLTISINNNLITKLEYSNSTKNISQEELYYPGIKTQTWYYWLQDCSPKIFAPDCIATTLYYGEQDSTLQQDVTCLDRVILNIIRQLPIQLPYNYNTTIGVYVGLDGAKELRKITENNIKTMLSKLGLEVLEMKDKKDKPALTLKPVTFLESIFGRAQKDPLPASRHSMRN